MDTAASVWIDGFFGSMSSPPIAFLSTSGKLYIDYFDSGIAKDLGDSLLNGSVVKFSVTYAV
jgi:hypothetical protein